MQNKDCFDVVILGNGAIGSALAIVLGLKHKIKTAIIGKADRHLSGSTAAGAMTNCYAEISEETFLYPHHEKFNLARQSLSYWEEWLNFVKSNTGSNIVHGKGTHLILNACGGHLDVTNFSIIEDYLIKNGISHAIENVDSLPLNPVDKYKPLRSLYIDNDGYVNPNSLFTAYDSLIHQNQEKIVSLHKTVTLIKSLKGGGYQVRFSDNTEIGAGKLVFAAGFFNQELFKHLPHITDIVPQFASVGCALNIFSENHGIKNVIRTPGRGGGCGFHLVPCDKDQLYFGATAYISPVLVSHPNVYNVNNLIQAFLQQFNRNFLFSKITNFLVGHRPFTIDKLPLIGPLHDPNLWIISGFNRDGFHCAPFIANEIAAMLVSNQFSKYQIFSPTRNPFFIRSIEESIDYFCNCHYLSALSEMEPKISSMHDEYILSGVRNDLMRIYDLLNISFGLDPEILWMLLRMYKQNNTHFADMKKIIRDVKIGMTKDQDCLV